MHAKCKYIIIIIVIQQTSKLREIIQVIRHSGWTARKTTRSNPMSIPSLSECIEVIFNQITVHESETVSV